MMSDPYRLYLQAFARSRMGQSGPPTNSGSDADIATIAIAVLDATDQPSHVKIRAPRDFATRLDQLLGVGCNKPPEKAPSIPDKVLAELAWTRWLLRWP